jgi:hypothetical protein
MSVNMIAASLRCSSALMFELRPFRIASGCRVSAPRLRLTIFLRVASFVGAARFPAVAHRQHWLALQRHFERRASLGASIFDIRDGLKLDQRCHLRIPFGVGAKRCSQKGYRHTILSERAGRNVFYGWSPMRRRRLAQRGSLRRESKGGAHLIQANSPLRA